MEDVWKELYSNSVLISGIFSRLKTEFIKRVSRVTSEEESETAEPIISPGTVYMKIETPKTENAILENIIFGTGENRRYFIPQNHCSLDWPKPAVF